MPPDFCHPIRVTARRGVRGKLQEELLHRVREDRIQRDGEQLKILFFVQYSPSEIFTCIPGKSVSGATGQRLRPKGGRDLQVFILINI